jgi:hypothetical protein
MSLSSLVGSGGNHTQPRHDGRTARCTRRVVEAISEAGATTAVAGAAGVTPRDLRDARQQAVILSSMEPCQEREFSDQRQGPKNGQVHERRQPLTKAGSENPASGGPFLSVSIQGQNSTLGGGRDRDRTWNPLMSQLAPVSACPPWSLPQVDEITAPVSHQKHLNKRETNAIEIKRKHSKINEADRDSAAHNGLVAGSSPAGPTNAGMHAIIFYPTAMSHIVTAKTQSITTLLAPTYGLSAQHANEPRGRRGPPAAISGRRAEERPATSRQGNLVLLRSH